MLTKYGKACLGGACIAGAVFICAIIMNSVMKGDVVTEPIGPPNNYWIPTEADIMWIDSLQTQVKDIETDVNELNVSVNRIDRKLDDMIEERLEYEDGTYDSIRYHESDELRMWIGNDGDTIWE
jgi:peptidoglycan hydrolase CwlO-like protein